ISPCPLATNVAAISFITRDATRVRSALTSGLLYTLGRTVAYVALAALLVSSVLSAPALSHALQVHMNRILGPLLVLVGMVLLGMLRLPGVGAPGAAPGFQRRAAAMGDWGAALLGLVFALSFCPVSAALFFGSLLPLAVAGESRLVLPMLFGVGTALPVLAFAVVISLGLGRVGDVFARTVSFERWLRRATGVVFIAVGVYLALENIFGAFS
ncbi:MAG TPA: sulfite exporter TauE/SafE family protein, partial [Halothiobacillaceae bacterium]|nr:sulfite exporter TauE/SafE family protein [Halothiobacillaceae bacterium]